MFKRITLLAIAAATLNGCAYKAQPSAVAAYDVYSSYGEKLPGKYLLYVDASALNKKVVPTGMSCAAHNYPVMGAEPFKTAVTKTLTNVVAQIEVVNSPVPANGLKQRGAKGMIVVKGQDMISRLRMVEGFVSSTAEADIEIVASVSVDGQNGRLFGTTVSGNGRAESSAGIMCEGGSDAVAQAATQAGKQTLTKLAEELSNSERLRTSK